jgi:hypothetical protein
VQVSPYMCDSSFLVCGVVPVTNLLWVQKSRTPEGPALQLVKHIIAYVVGEVPIGVGSPEGGSPKGCEPQGVLEPQDDPQVQEPSHT